MIRAGLIRGCNPSHAAEAQGRKKRLDGTADNRRYTRITDHDPTTRHTRQFQVRSNVRGYRADEMKDAARYVASESSVGPRGWNAGSRATSVPLLEARG